MFLPRDNVCEKGHMLKIRFIDKTKHEFQRYQTTLISDEQAIEIQTNLFGVISLLLKWQDLSETNRNCV